MSAGWAVHSRATAARHQCGASAAATTFNRQRWVMGPVIVRPIQLEAEASPTCRPIRHASDVTAMGVDCFVEVDGRWRRGVITRVEYSTVHVLLRREASD